VETKELPCVPTSSTQKRDWFSTLVAKLHRFCNDCVKTLNNALSELAAQVRRRPGVDLLVAMVDVIRGGQTPFAFDATDANVVLRAQDDVLASADASSFYGVFIRDEHDDLVIDMKALMDVLSWDPAFVRRGVGTICDAVEAVCGVCNTRRPECTTHLTELLAPGRPPHVAGEVRGLLRSFDGSGLLETIDSTQLRLFGERRSPIIDCLDEHVAWEGRPIFRLFGTPGSRHLIGVPYHANVGVFVVNHGVLQEVLKGRDAAELAAAITEEYRQLKETDDRPVADPAIQEAAMHLAESLKAGGNPQTWEEVMVLCSLFHGSCADPDLCFPLLLETRTTFDTYMASFLEVLWSTGAILDIHPDYACERVTKLPGPGMQPIELPLEESLLWTFRLFRNLFGRRFTPCDSSLEVEYVRTRLDQIARQREEKGTQSAGIWLFARHWYSTLVDMLTARKDPHTGNGDFLIRPEDLGGPIDMTPVPLALDEYLRQWRLASVPLQKFQATHHPCCGEWYFTVLKGSENEALAVDLINNLMSGQKVAERAFMCAGVPTVEDFYRLYSDVRCINIPAREDRDRLPRQSWGEFRRSFMRGAMSRTAVFDYRHCIRELHAVLELVRNTAAQTRGGFVPLTAALDRLIKDALDRIEQLAKKSVLLHRQDVEAAVGGRP
jgi:hypothetical protein